MILQIFLVIVLICFNAFFVVAEFSLVKVRSSIIDIKVQEGNKSAKIVHDIHNNMNAYLSACQLGITLSSLALGWIGEEAASHIISSLLNMVGVENSSEIAKTITIPLAFFMITYLHIILGEQLPKTMGLQYSDKLSFAVALPMRIFYNVFRPLIWVLNTSSELLLKMLGASPNYIHEEHSAEELKILIDKGKESGAIQTADHELIENVFHFNEMMAKQIMIPRTKMMALEVSTSDAQIMEIIHSEGFSRLPVYKDVIDDVVGIVSTKEILKMVAKGETIILSNHLRPAYFIPETKKIGDLLKDFQKKRLHMAVVIDEFGGTAGIVTMEDVIEELVGEIRDEDDEEEKPLIEKITEGEYMVSGLVSIANVNEVLRYPLPEGDDFETVSGLMSFVFGKIPELNDEKEFGGYHFTIISTAKKQVEMVRIVEVLKSDD